MPFSLRQKGWADNHRSRRRRCAATPGPQVRDTKPHESVMVDSLGWARAHRRNVPTCFLSRSHLPASAGGCGQGHLVAEQGICRGRRLLCGFLGPEENGLRENLAGRPSSDCRMPHRPTREPQSFYWNRAGKPVAHYSGVPHLSVWLLPHRERGAVRACLPR